MTQKKKQHKVSKKTEEILKLLKQIPYEELNSVRSFLHSATIKKGNTHSIEVMRALSVVPYIVRIDAEQIIKFDSIVIPREYSQSSYKVDIWFETETQIILIDPKSAGHDNNTPISDEVKKWVYAKQQVESNYPNKNVRFVLLKPNDVSAYDFNRLKNQYEPFGLELYITDDFLMQETGVETQVSNNLEETKHKLMIEGIESLFL
jgi:hypothetical protein